jgi:hypothetical protein
MLSKSARNELRRSSFYKNIEMENQYDLVTSFYPAQRLTLELKVEDLIQIMNCDYTKAQRYNELLRKKYNTFLVRTFDFCDHMDIDEMLIQVFLASLKKEGPLPPRKKRKPVPENPLEATNGPRRMIKDIKDDLQKGIMESFETIQLRAMKWKMENPMGEPMYKIADIRYRIIIRPYEVAHIIGLHIQTARQMFNEARITHSVPKQRFMSLKLFCNAHHIDEEDTRRALSEFHNDSPPYHYQ